MIGRSERTRLAFAATAAASRWAARSGVDVLGIASTPAIAVTLQVGIRAEALARRKHSCAVMHPAEPVHVHVGGAGPAVLFLNGWTASGLVWPTALISALEREHRVVRADNRGTGWSRQAARPYTIGDLAGDVRRVIDDLGLGEPVVVGLSMGGMIAQELAIRWPDRVGRLVLLATRPPSPEQTWPPPMVSASMLATAPEGVALRGFLAEGWARATAPGFRVRRPEAVDEMAASIARRPTLRFAVLDQARAIAAWAGATRLGEITVPTTVVHGTEDPLVPVRNGMRIAQLIPGARYVELPNVGHLIPYEAPDVVQAVVDDRF